MAVIEAGAQTVFVRDFEKLAYFRQALDKDPNNEIYRRSLKDLMERGVEGQSGRRYRRGDVVRIGPFTSMGEKRRIKIGFVSIFDPNPLTQYERDGLPVIVISIKELGGFRKFLNSFTPDVGPFFSFNFFKR